MKKKSFSLVILFIALCMSATAQVELPEESRPGHEIWYYVQFEETGLVIEQHGVAATTWPDNNHNRAPLTRMGQPLTAETPVSGRGEQLWKVEKDAAGVFYIFYNYADPNLKMVYKSFNNDYGSGYYSSYARYDVEYGNDNGQQYQASSYNNFTIMRTTDGQHLSLNARNNEADYFVFPVEWGEKEILGPPYSAEPGARLFRNRNNDAGTERGNGNGDYGINPHCWVRFVPAEQLFPDCGVNYAATDLMKIDIAAGAAPAEVIDGDPATTYTFGAPLNIDLGENATAFQLAAFHLKKPAGSAASFDLKINDATLGSITIAAEDEDGWLYLPLNNEISGRYLTIANNGGALAEIEIYRINSYTGLPYPAPRTLPATIEAENYDAGGEGIAYHDLEPGHQGGGTIHLRPTEGVEIEQGPSGGYHVGWTNPGEWLKYTVISPSDSYYDFTFTVANQNSSSFTVLVNDSEVPELKDIEMQATGSYETYKDITVEKVKLYAGTNVLTLKVNSGNFDKITISRTPYAGSPYPASGAVVIPTSGEVKIEAEDFDRGGEGVAFHDRDEGRSGSTEIRYGGEDNPVDIYTTEDGKIYIGSTNMEEWLNYSISVTEDGIYDFVIAHRHGDGNGTGNYLLLDDVSLRVFDLKSTPNSGADWTEDLIVNIPLTAGEHVLTVHVWADFDYFIVRRTVRSPFTDFTDGHVQTISANGESIIQAAAFDNGGEGSAYHDTNTDGSNNAARTDVGVGIGAMPAGSETPYYVKDIDDGEWILLTVDVEKSAYYYINRIMMAGREGIGKFSILLDEDISNPLLPLYTPESDAQGLGIMFELFPAQAQPQLIRKGRHIIRINAEQGGFEIAFIEFAKDHDYNDTGINDLYASGRVFTDRKSLKVEDFEGASLTVYNIVGQRITSKNKLSANETFNLPQRGIYVVCLTKDGINRSIKIRL